MNILEFLAVMIFVTDYKHYKKHMRVFRGIRIVFGIIKLV